MTGRDSALSPAVSRMVVTKSCSSMGVSKTCRCSSMVAVLADSGKWMLGLRVGTSASAAPSNNEGKGGTTTSTSESTRGRVFMLILLTDDAWANPCGDLSSTTSVVR